MRSISLLALIAIALTNYAKGDVTITAADAGGGHEFHHRPQPRPAAVAAIGLPPHITAGRDRSLHEALGMPHHDRQSHGERQEDQGRYLYR